MSIFGTILSTIFGSPAHAETVPPGAKTASTAPSGSGKPAAAQSVDVAAILDKLTKESREKGLDWRKSIVDLMKLLNLDSSLAARKELAQELGYTGSTKDSAAMNVWLHKQVMTKLAENGGNVPDDLKS